MQWTSAMFYEMGVSWGHFKIKGIQKMSNLRSYIYTATDFYVYAGAALRSEHVRFIVRGQMYDGRLTI